jgi:hypothetical protein
VVYRQNLQKYLLTVLEVTTPEAFPNFSVDNSQTPPSIQDTTDVTRDTPVPVPSSTGASSATGLYPLETLVNAARLDPALGEELRRYAQRAVELSPDDERLREVKDGLERAHVLPHQDATYGTENNPMPQNAARLVCERGYIRVQSKALGEVVYWCRDHRAVEAVRAIPYYQGEVCYTISELKELRGRGAEFIANVHLVKKTFDATLVETRDTWRPMFRLWLKDNRWLIVTYSAGTTVEEAKLMAEQEYGEDLLSVEEIAWPEHGWVPA